jgi:2,3-bisphosphoglycerate-independent phosphoglycerate mutase
MIWNPFTKNAGEQKRTKPANGPQNIIKPMVLLSLDGYGIAPPSEGNAITRAKTPNMDKYYSTYPNGELIASGESVGLPANEEGNSEVGHLAMGVGAVIPQSLKRISVSIEDGTFYENRAFIQTVAHVKKYSSKLHLMGLVSTGSVHSSMEHLYALLEFCRREEITQVCLHLFTDGRDAPPRDGIKVISEVERRITNDPGYKITSVTGRYYAMDRDQRWARTKKAYEVIVLGKGNYAVSASEAIKNSYAKDTTDEFVEPTVILEKQKPAGLVDDNDAVIFFNFRVDRPRQLTMVFVLTDFEQLERYEFEPEPDHERRQKQLVSGSTFKRTKWPENIFFTTMTQYQKKTKVSAVAFTPLKAKTSLAKVLSEHGLKQLHLSESEKERMVTIYFDGLNEQGFAGEGKLIVPSPKVATYDKKPEMSVYQIVDAFKKTIARNKYHFFVLNFANPDMVAHSGNIKATIKAVEHVDKAIGMMVDEISKVDGTLVISADHGNAEELLTFPTNTFFFTTEKGDVNTDHSSNPVPLIIINKAFKGKTIKLPRGSLADIAPTILSMMGLTIPKEMTGKNLLAPQAESTFEQPQIGGMPLLG